MSKRLIGQYKKADKLKRQSLPVFLSVCLSALTSLTPGLACRKTYVLLRFKYGLFRIIIHMLSVDLAFVKLILRSLFNLFFISGNC